MSHAFVDAVRDCDWPRALAALAKDPQPGKVPCPGSSIPAWLVELNAPADTVVECLRLCADADSLRSDALGLLGICVERWHTHLNAPATFSALLRAGVSPNAIIRGGETLFQHLVERNRKAEILELLHYGLEAKQCSAFGPESTSNREAAKRLGNAAALAALEHWTRTHGSSAPESA